MKVTLILCVFSGSDVGSKWQLLLLLHPTTKHFDRSIGDILSSPAPDSTQFRKKKHWVDFYHYRMDVHTHLQHTFMFKQLEMWILHPMTPLTLLSLRSECTDLMHRPFNVFGLGGLDLLCCSWIAVAVGYCCSCRLLLLLQASTGTCYCQCMAIRCHEYLMFPLLGMTRLDNEMAKKKKKKGDQQSFHFTFW